MTLKTSLAAVFAVLLLAAAGAPAADDPQVTHFMDKDEARVPVQTSVPVYPARARRDRVEGDVQVCFNIDRKGRPFRIAVRSSTNRVFEKPAIRAVRASRYRSVPEDEAVSQVKSCRTFRFRLESVDEAEAGPAEVQTPGPANPA